MAQKKPKSYTHRATVPPIYQSAVFDFERVEDLAAQIKSGPAFPPSVDDLTYIYARGGNPTQRKLELDLTALEHADDALTFASPGEAKELNAIERAVGRRLARRRIEGFDYDARPQGRFEIPIGERIAEIRSRRAEERARARAKQEKRAARAANGATPPPRPPQQRRRRRSRPAQG